MQICYVCPSVHHDISFKPKAWVYYSEATLFQFKPQEVMQ